MVCARFDDSNIRVVFQNLSAGVHRLHDGHLHLGLVTLGLKYSHISPGGLFSGSTVDIVSNILNAVSLIVLLFAWSRNDDK